MSRIIQKKASIRNHPFLPRRPGKQVTLSEPEIKGLILKSREIFMSQSTLLELEVCHSLVHHLSIMVMTWSKI